MLLHGQRARVYDFSFIDRLSIEGGGVEKGGEGKIYVWPSLSMTLHLFVREKDGLGGKLESLTMRAVRDEIGVFPFEFSIVSTLGRGGGWERWIEEFKNIQFDSIIDSFALFLWWYFCAKTISNEN